MLFYRNYGKCHRAVPPILLYGVFLGELILRHTDDLRKKFQSPNISAAEGELMAKLTIATLPTLRNNKKFNEFLNSRN